LARKPTKPQEEFVLGNATDSQYASPHSRNPLLRQAGLQGPPQKAAMPHTSPTRWSPRFEGEYGLPKTNQTRPREAGHKPAF